MDVDEAVAYVCRGDEGAGDWGLRLGDEGAQQAGWWLG